MTMNHSLLFALFLIAPAMLAGPPATAASETEASHLAAYTAPQVPVTLNATVLVEAPVVRLGDLFDGLQDLAETPVARAPAPGARVTLDARWLYTVARNYGVPWQPQSSLDSVVVERASQVIDRERIEAYLRDVLADQGVLGDVELFFDTADLTMNLPSDADDSLRLARWSFDPANGRFQAKLVAPADGAAAARLTVNGRAVNMIEVPVPARRLSKGDVIGDGDITWIRLRADRLGRNVLSDASALIGQSPRRTLREGQPVRANDLRQPVVIAKNSMVTIRLETDRMVLTAQGRALQDGAQDQVIRVMNTHSNVVVSAVVEQSGLVAVSKANPPAMN